MFEEFAQKYTKKELSEIVNSFIGVLFEKLTLDERIYIAPLGTFFNRKRKQRTIKHPFTGNLVEVKEGLVPAYTPSSTIKKIMIEQKP